MSLKTPSRLVLVLMQLAVFPLTQSCRDVELSNSTPSTDSGVDSPSYDAILDRLNGAAAQNPNVQVLEYGRTVRGRAMKMLRIGLEAPQSAGQARPLILISEAIHGNEFLDIGYRLAEDYARDAGTAGTQMNQFVLRGGVMLVVPVVNPDGYTYSQELTPDQRQTAGGPDGGNNWGRLNANRKDLNRDWPVPSARLAGRTQPEIQSLTDAVQGIVAQGYKLEFSLDYHCCIGQGALLWPYGYSNALQMAAADRPRFEAAATNYRSTLGRIQVGTGPQIVGYNAAGVSTDYFYDTFKTVSFIYEASVNGEVSRLDAHRRALLGVVDGISSRYQPLAPSPIPPAAITPTDTLHIAVIGGTGNSAMIQIAAAQNGSEVRLCEGPRSTCTGPNVPMAAKLPASGTRDVVTFFGGATGTAVDGEKSYTLILVDAAGQEISFRSFRLGRI